MRLTVSLIYDGVLDVFHYETESIFVKLMKTGASPLLQNRTG